MFFRVFLISIFVFISGCLFAQTTDLFISEYVEGSSSNKYIEIYNGTGASVNLADYELRLYSNGAATPSTTNSLSGILANNSVIVYKNSSASIYAGTATVASAVNFNGDDAIALFKISTTSFVDIFGNIGCDPGSAWTSGAFTTADKTLVRNANVCGGVIINPGGCPASFPTQATEWTQFNQDDVSNLGSHTNTCLVLPPCLAPISQPTNLVLSNITFSSIDGSFTGNGADGYLVVASTNTTLSGNPINGTTYNPGDPLGGGTVVSVGTSTSFTASGLSGSTTYYFFVFAYTDISCSGAPAYNTVNPLNNNATTLVPPAFSSAVVVSEYFNDSDPRDEWIELIVVADNTDMRNWTLRDNNSDTDNWQTEITFNNIAFWNNMRGGTIIKIWSRRHSSLNTIVRAIDINKDDGYIELYADHSTYFTGGNFGLSPTYGGSSLNCANNGDLLQLRDASNNHVHALGHDGAPGSDWTSCPTPKVLRNDNISGGESIRVVGNATSNYDGGSTTNNSIVTFGSTGITSGLANDSNNELLWRSWREPIFTTQAVVGNVCGATCINFTWNKMTDPVPNDDVQGYLILRKTTAGSFIDPTDGTSYAPLSLLGTGTVVANLDNPTVGTTVSYTDNLAALGTDEYRIYGYRYTDDNINGNSFDLARGRAYNISNYVTVTLAIPLPIELLYFNGKSTSMGNLLEWSTSSEINNDYFTVEKSEDAINFIAIGEIDGAGNSNNLLTYDFTDNNLKNSTNYYRLKQTDFDGAYTYSNIIATDSEFTQPKIFINSQTLNISNITSGKLEIFDISGRLISRHPANNNIKIDLKNLKTGVYIYRLILNDKIISDKFFLH